MSDVIHGKDCYLEMFVSSTWTPVLCATDMTFEYNPEFITKTGPNSPAREYAMRIYDWSMSVTGLTKLANDTVLSFFYMLQTSIRRQSHEFRARFVDSNNVEKQISGTAFIGHSTITGPATDFCNATIEFRGTGAFEISTVDFVVDSSATENILADWWATENGDSWIDGASSGQTDGTTYTLVSTDEILRVWVEGTGFEIVTGTPATGTLECQLDLSNGKIIFPVTFDGTQRVTVLFKR